MEWRLIAARWIGILFVGPALPFLNLPLNRLAGAYAILLAATTYNVVIRWWMLRHEPLLYRPAVSLIQDN